MGCLNAEIYTLEPDPDNAGEGIMRIVILFVLFFNLSVYANKYTDQLVIYTYDSFVSDWGPGDIIKKKFKEKFDHDIKFLAVDSAATLLTKIILEGSSTKADIVLGLDMNLF